jgi:hypothetical protein
MNFNDFYEFELDKAVKNPNPQNHSKKVDREQEVQYFAERALNSLR